VVIGAYGDDNFGLRSGAAYGFEKSSTGRFEEASKLMARDGARDDIFGADLAGTGNTIVVGAYRADVKGSNSGAAYVFERNSTGQYEQAFKLVASDGDVNDWFGRALSVTGDMIVVGANGDDDKGSVSGSAYVFEKNSTGQYEQMGKLVASDGAAGDFFGIAVAATGSMLVVGARTSNDDNKGSDSGSVYLFEKNSTGQFEQVSKLMASDGAANDNFGSHVAVTDGIIVVGSIGDDVKGVDSGSAYVFEYLEL
jgi:hypothetical protein